MKAGQIYAHALHTHTHTQCHIINISNFTKSAHQPFSVCVFANPQREATWPRRIVQHSTVITRLYCVTGCDFPECIKPCAVNMLVTCDDACIERCVLISVEWLCLFLFNHIQLVVFGNITFIHAHMYEYVSHKHTYTSVRFNDEKLG